MLTAIEIGFWVTITTVYREERKRNDLWGWSCTAIAKDLQNGGGSADFSKLCNLQVSCNRILRGTELICTTDCIVVSVPGGDDSESVNFDCVDYAEEEAEEGDGASKAESD